jgi:hypothetical protein
MKRKIAIKKPETSSALCDSMHQLFNFGDFLSLRKICRATSVAPDSSPKELALSQRMLKITKPDSIALIVGALCFLFVLCVSFLVAY